MPSFDIVCEIDMHEVTNAVDQANREVTNRYDFKGCDASYELVGEDSIKMKTESDFQLKQMIDILQSKFVKRGIDLNHLDIQTPDIQMKTATQEIKLRQGISKEDGKMIVKMIKDQKLKVQASIQGEQVRVTGKKRDDLQSVIAFFKESKLELPLQFNNFRD